MKKLFTLCAVATMALTTSAQQTDVSKGSMYLGITNAMDIMDEDAGLVYTAGYAIQDGLLIMISSGQDSRYVKTADAVAEVIAVDGVEAVEAVEAADAVFGDDPSTPDIVEEDFEISPAVEAVEGVEGVDAVEGVAAQPEQGEIRDFDKRTLNLHVRYFKNGYYAQANLNDFNGATEEDGADNDMDLTLSVGAMYNIGAINGMYIDPSMTIGQDASDEWEMSFNVGLGMRF